MTTTESKACLSAWLFHLDAKSNACSVVLRANNRATNIHELANGHVGENICHVDVVVQSGHVAAVVTKVVGPLRTGATQMIGRVRG